MQILSDHVQVSYLDSDGSKNKVIFSLNDIAFQGSLDKLMNVAKDCGWTVTRIDFLRV